MSGKENSQQLSISTINHVQFPSINHRYLSNLEIRFILILGSIAALFLEDPFSVDGTHVFLGISFANEVWWLTGEITQA